jgi:hypothetical protein
MSAALRSDPEAAVRLCEKSDGFGWQELCRTIIHASRDGLIVIGGLSTSKMGGKTPIAELPRVGRQT